MSCTPSFKIVILGSSTAFGTGATPIDSSFVNRYKDYIHTKNPLHTIINLATLSLTTYHVLCPTGYVPPPGRPSPDVDRNITKALTFNPDAIIINLPSNDIALGIPQSESKANYELTMALADAANIPVWVTTTQPRNTLSPAERVMLMEFRDWTYLRFGDKAIDFWTDVANPDGTINATYSFGDGVHVNNNGHNLFSIRTRDEHILDSLCIRFTALPLHLLDFSARQSGSQVHLTWVTESESDLDKFILERSMPGQSWSEIGTVTAFNSPGRHNYLAADIRPNPGVNFYRLKQMDRNGTFTYSRIVRVSLSKNKALDVSYNPSTKEAVIRTDRPLAWANLTDMEGRVLQQFSAPPSNRLQLNPFPAGIYILKVSTAGELQSAKLFLR